jgi:hypothetical protein
MKRIGNFLVAVFLACTACIATADHHLFTIEQVYSNADGSVQFIVMRNILSSDNEHRWASRSLFSSGSGGPSKMFTFPSDLPSRFTADKAVLIATEGFAALGLVTPDYVIPNGFLQVPAGTVNFAGVAILNYTALPTNGTHALSGNNAVVNNVARNFAGDSASVTAPASPAPAVAIAVEYFNATFDHYFITHFAPEIVLLDAGTTIRGWTRTGQSFKVYTSSSTDTSPVCRFYIPPDKGDSHFYGRGTTECDATGSQNPSFVREASEFFHVKLPVVGVCPAGTVPVYRVFSNRTDANHRYMVDRAIRSTMTGSGWVAEGDGPDLVVMCAPA